MVVMYGIAAGYLFGAGCSAGRAAGSPIATTCTPALRSRYLREFVPAMAG